MAAFHFFHRQSLTATSTTNQIKSKCFSCSHLRELDQIRTMSERRLKCEKGRDGRNPLCAMSHCIQCSVCRHSVCRLSCTLDFRVHSHRSFFRLLSTPRNWARAELEAPPTYFPVSMLHFSPALKSLRSNFAARPNRINQTGARQLGGISKHKFA